MSVMVGQIFLQAEGFGWSETYYPQAEDYLGAFTNLDAVNTARMALSLPDVTVVGMRVSDLSVRGDAYHDIPNTKMGTYVGASAKTVDPNMAVLVQIISDDYKTHAVRYIRGVPDTVLSFHPLTYLNPGPPDAWRFGTSGYITAMRANMQMVIREPGPSWTVKPISIVAFERATIRKAGRPFALPVGRRVSV